MVVFVAVLSVDGQKRGGLVFRAFLSSTVFTTFVFGKQAYAYALR